MFRSDDLYREMNYMIEKLSPLLLSNICVSSSIHLTNLLVFIGFFSLLAPNSSKASRWVLKH